MRLTDKQRKFCDEYLIDLNATQAAIRAGYTEKYANTNASKLLQNTTISQYIGERQKELSRKTEITQERVIRELALIAFSNTADYAHVVEKKMKAEVQDEHLTEQCWVMLSLKRRPYLLIGEY